MANKKLIFTFSFLIALSLSFGTSFSAEKKKAAPKKKSVSRISDISYKIGAGDVLRIITWKETDFSLEEIRGRTGSHC